MTGKEIEKYRKELVKITATEDSGQRDKAFAELRNKVGAAAGESDGDNIDKIHQALQTASMIEICRTAARNYWIAFAVSLVALASAVAAWAAVYVNVLAQIKNQYF